MIRFFCYLLFTSSLIFGCSNQNKNQREKHIEVNDYSFFPDDAGSLEGDIFIIDTLAFHNTVETILKRQISPDRINEILELKKIKHVKITDECVVVINDFINSNNINEKLKDQRSKVNSSCKNTLIPIPNFWSINDSMINTKSHLDNNCEIILIDLKLGLRTKRIDPSKSSLEGKYKHGEVNGIILNRKKMEAIYFVQKW